MARPIVKKASVRTERLVMHPFSDADAERLKELLTHPEVTKTFMVPEFESDDQARALIGKLIAFSQIEDTRHFEYGVYLRDELIGFVNDCGIGEDEIEIGYVIDPGHQGHGYATEAVSAAIRELREMGFKRVTAGYFAKNTASRRVMEKCGMKPTGQVEEEEYRGVMYPCVYCEIRFPA